MVSVRVSFVPAAETYCADYDRGAVIAGCGVHRLLARFVGTALERQLADWWESLRAEFAGIRYQRTILDCLRRGAPDRRISVWGRYIDCALIPRTVRYGRPAFTFAEASIGIGVALILACGREGSHNPRQK